MALSRVGQRGVNPSGYASPPPRELAPKRQYQTTSIGHFGNGKYNCRFCYILRLYAAKFLILRILASCYPTELMLPPWPRPLSPPLTSPGASSIASGKTTTKKKCVGAVVEMTRVQRLHQRRGTVPPVGSLSGSHCNYTEQRPNLNDVSGGEATSEATWDSLFFSLGLNRILLSANSPRLTADSHSLPKAFLLAHAPSFFFVPFSVSVVLFTSVTETAACLPHTQSDAVVSAAYLCNVVVVIAIDVGCWSLHTTPKRKGAA